MADELGPDHTAKPKLRRVISGPLLVFYGLGTMLGAGIYALIGEVAGAAGVFAPAAFILAAAIASLTAGSFAELSSRFPKSAGEAVYVSAGFNNERLSLLAGFMIVASGIVSSGVMFRGFVGYAGEIIAFPVWLGFFFLAILVGAVAAWGIAESLIAIAVITIIEAGALLLVIGLGFAAEPIAFEGAPNVANGGAVAGVLSGAVLAFYAFIGFEDMVNVVEEVKKPRRVMPLSILLALVLATMIYVAVAFAAVRTTPIALLAQSDAPMTLIFSRLTDVPAYWMSTIATVAVVNGALVQIVMGSRVLYGLAQRDAIHEWFGRIAARTQTPVNATLFIVALVLLSALTLPLATLAQATSFLLLTVFAMVNIALIRIKRRGEPNGGFMVPIIIPYLGAASAAALAVISLAEIVR